MRAQRTYLQFSTREAPRGTPLTLVGTPPDTRQLILLKPIAFPTNTKYDKTTKRRYSVPCTKSRLAIQQQPFIHSSTHYPASSSLTIQCANKIRSHRFPPSRLPQLYSPFRISTGETPTQIIGCSVPIQLWISPIC